MKLPLPCIPVATWFGPKTQTVLDAALTPAQNSHMGDILAFSARIYPRSAMAHGHFCKALVKAKKRAVDFPIIELAKEQRAHLNDASLSLAVALGDNNIFRHASDISKEGFQSTYDCYVFPRFAVIVPNVREVAGLNHVRGWKWSKLASWMKNTAVVLVPDQDSSHAKMEVIGALNLALLATNNFDMMGEFTSETISLVPHWQ